MCVNSFLSFIVRSFQVEHGSSSGAWWVPLNMMLILASCATFLVLCSRPSVRLDLCYS
jgi:hypothetical protein